MGLAYRQVGSRLQRASWVTRALLARKMFNLNIFSRQQRAAKLATAAEEGLLRVLRSERATFAQESS